MTKLDLTKNVVSFVVGMGTSKIVSSIIKNNVQPDNAIDTISVAAGSIVLGSMVADISKTYTDAKIDEIANWYAKNVTNRNSN